LVTVCFCFQGFLERTTRRKSMTEAPSGYKLLGPGHCNQGYVGGWVAADANDLSTCQAKCSSEPNCKYISLNMGRSCSRYSEAAGECDPRPHGRADHLTYEKLKEAITSLCAPALLRTLQIVSTWAPWLYAIYLDGVSNVPSLFDEWCCSCNHDL
jgi:hypothetical protein